MTLSQKWIFLIGMTHLVFSLVINQNGSTVTVVNCIAQITNLLGREKVAIEFTEDRRDFTSEILKKIKIPVVLNTKEIRKFHGIERRPSISLMIILRETEPEKLLKNCLWDRETRFLIISQEVKKIEKYFQHFWKSKVVNVFAITTNEEGISMYSFLPYAKQNCTVIEIFSVDKCLEGKLKNGGFALNDSTRIKNMNQCPVNITVTDVRPNVIFEPDGERNTSSSVKGFEGNLMAEVAKIYNFKPVYKLPEDGIEWGWITPSPAGAVGEVYSGLSDITIGMLGPVVERFENLDFSKTYNMDECLTFAVPQGCKTKKSTWITIFVLEFTFTIWFLIILSFVLISVNVWLVNRYLSVGWFQSTTELVLFLFSGFLGLPIKVPNFVSAKTSLIFWIIFSFITNVAYKASMGSKLAVPPRDADIYTFQELLETDLELLGLKNMAQLLRDPEDLILKEIKKRYHFANYSIENVVERIANRDKIATLRHTSTFYYYSLINPKARGRIHLLSECLILYHPIVLMKKFSPFTNKISQIVTRLEESGIMAMWRAEYTKRNPPDLSKPFFKLSVDQMFGIFGFLCLGYAVAAISFLCETYFYFRGL